MESCGESTDAIGSIDAIDFASRITSTSEPTCHAAKVLAPERLFSASELRERLHAGNGIPTVLFFRARACRICHVLQPKLERLVQAASARLLHVWHDKLTHDIFIEYDVTETPTICVFDALGKMVSCKVYFMEDLPQLATLLDKLQDESPMWDI